METLSIILAGGQGNRLDLLSHKRSKPALPFAGKFRIIDFCLSNLMHSHLLDVAILTQYMPLSLIEHIGSGKPWDLDRLESHVTILQPHKEWYDGTADAIKKNLDFILHTNAKYILILSGDHIYKMDYRRMIEEHKRSGNAVTIAAQIVDSKDVSRFGILETDSCNRITSFVEKPKSSKSRLASMGIYVFSVDCLVHALQNNEQKDCDFGKHIIPYILNTSKEQTGAYIFNGYWMDVGTYDSYMEANLDLTKSKPQLDLYEPNWKIHTKSEDLPPARIGINSKVKQSLVSNGAVIEGEVVNSVISPGVYIGKNSIIRNSIILNDTIISDNVTVDNCIIDKHVTIGVNSIVGEGANDTPNKEKPEVLNCGITVAEKGAVIPSNVRIGRNVRIKEKAEFKSNIVANGETI